MRSMFELNEPHRPRSAVIARIPTRTGSRSTCASDVSDASDLISAATPKPSKSVPKGLSETARSTRLPSAFSTEVRFLRLIAPALIALVPIGLVLGQPDLGTAMMMSFTAATIILFARVKNSVLVALGVRPDGSKLKPPMGVPYYAKMSDADLDALVAYLRTLPRK